jgi:hypothetical protein
MNHSSLCHPTDIRGISVPAKKARAKTKKINKTKERGSNWCENKNKICDISQLIYIVYEKGYKSKFVIFSICDFLFLHYTLFHIHHYPNMEKSIQEQEQIKKMPNKRAAAIKKLPQKDQENIE